MKYILSSFKIGCGLYILFDFILTATNRYIDGISAKLFVLLSIQLMVFLIENGIADFLEENRRRKCKE